MPRRALLLLSLLVFTLNAWGNERDTWHGVKARQEGQRVCAEAARAVGSGSPTAETAGAWAALAKCLQSKSDPQQPETVAFGRQLGGLLEAWQAAAKVSLETGTLVERPDVAAITEALRADAWAWFLVTRVHDTHDFALPSSGSAAASLETAVAHRAEWKLLHQLMLDREHRGGAQPAFRAAVPLVGGLTGMAPTLGKAYCPAGATQTRCLANYEQFLFVWLGAPPSAALASRPPHAMSPAAGACALADGSRVSDGSVSGQGAQACHCRAGTLTCPATPPTKALARKPESTCALPPSLTTLPLVRAPAGLTLDDGCATRVCREGAWVDAPHACPEAKVMRVVPLGRSETGLVSAELLVLDRTSRALSAATAKGLIGASPLRLRFVNVSQQAVTLGTGDQLRWTFKASGPTKAAVVEPSMEQFLAVGTPVTLEPGGFLEVAMPWLINGDRADPAPFAWSSPGRFELGLTGTLQLEHEGQRELCAFATPAPVLVEVTP